MNTNKEYRKLILNIKLKVMRFVLITAFLAFVNWQTSPSYWWVFWVIAGWGLGLSLNLFSQYMNYKMEKE